MIAQKRDVFGRSEHETNQPTWSYYIPTCYVGALKSANCVAIESRPMHPKTFINVSTAVLQTWLVGGSNVTQRAKHIQQNTACGIWNRGV